MKQNQTNRYAFIQNIETKNLMLVINTKFTRLANSIHICNARQLQNMCLSAPVANNPLPWTAHWLSSKGLQVAPQETEVESYMIGSIKQDVKKDTFSNFKL